MCQAKSSIQASSTDNDTDHGIADEARTSSMTVWRQAICDACGTGIGTGHPLFTTRKDTGYPWIPFVACSICGRILCTSCTVDSEGVRRALKSGAKIPFPPCGDPTLDVESTWHACPSCAAEFCDACARERRSRCSCGGAVQLRAVPPWTAYLPGDLSRGHAVLPEDRWVVNWSASTAAMGTMASSPNSKLSAKPTL